MALPVSLTWQVSPFQDAQTVEDSDGFTRHDISANVSRYMLQDTYFPAFELAIKGGARGVMCAYNAVRDPGRPLNRCGAGCLSRLTAVGGG